MEEKALKKKKKLRKLMSMSTLLIGVNLLNLQIIKFYTRTKLKNLTRLTCDLRCKMGTGAE
jgi:hypothetical protein